MHSRIISDDISRQVDALHNSIILHSTSKKAQSVYCSELFESGSLSEELKHALARRTYKFAFVLDWIYRHSPDDALLDVMNRQAPLKTVHVSSFASNPHHSWETLRKFLYLGSRENSASRLRANLLRNLPDEYYSRYSQEFFTLAKSMEFAHPVHSRFIITRLKECLGMGDVSEEWFTAVFTAAA